MAASALNLGGFCSARAIVFATSFRVRPAFFTTFSAAISTPKGSHSKAQGAAQRNPGIVAGRELSAPTGRHSPAPRPTAASPTIPCAESGNNALSGLRRFLSSRYPGFHPGLSNDAPSVLQRPSALPTFPLSRTISQAGGKRHIVAVRDRHQRVDLGSAIFARSTAFFALEKIARGAA